MTGSVPTIALCPMSQSLKCPAVPHTKTKDGVATSAGIRHYGTRKTAWLSVADTWQQLRFINRVWRERRMLASLSDEALKDVGLNRADVERESGRSPLDLPRRRNSWQ
jgi:uncharacterized protein YjiS (DUF1127 family)